VTPAEPTPVEQRLLILAPTPRDSELLNDILRRAGLSCASCPDPARLRRELDAGAAAIVVGEEALEHDGRWLGEIIASQPRWSDLPILVLTRTGADSRVLTPHLVLLGNVTLMERPVRIAALVSTARAALRARLRQYEIRAHLLERERSDRRRATELAVSRVLAGATSAGEVLPSLLQAVCECLGCEVADAWLVDESAGILRCTEFWGSGCDGFESDTRGRRIARGEGLPGRVWETGRPVWLEALDTPDFLRRVSATQEGLRSGFGVPILRGHEAIGVLEFFTRATWKCDANLLATIGSVSAHLGEYLDRKNAEEALRRSERNLNDFFENASIGLHCVALDGTILRANQAELDMLGYTNEEYVGRNVAEFHVDAPRLRDLMDRLGRGETLQNHEARMRARDGGIRHVLISSNALIEGGRLVHTRCFTRDITERKLAEQALEEADRRKTEFLATLAHELRNPLAPIRTAATLIARADPGRSELRWGRDVIERQIQQLTRLVDDLLDVSRITRGKIELKKERVDLAAVVRSALETSHPLIEAAGHTITVSLPPDPIVLDADPVRLAQVLSNLFNNAAKFTPDGGEIRLGVEKEGGTVSISVADNGNGIAPELLPRIFDMFVQADRSLERAQGGLGIGLTLVRWFVEMHGGSVSAHSAGPGLGSAFIVRLPTAAETVTMDATNHSEDRLDFVPARPRRILVADDNRDGRESLRLLLEAMGNEVRTAIDGEEAVAVAAEFGPEVALLDIGMPRINGYEAARQIRERPGGEQIVLVALTGWGKEDDRRRSREAGFDHHWVKPVDISALQRLFS
jgi:PAS domain S-box-containing protein